MNKQIKPLHLALIVLSTLILLPTTARAQGTAFTYQGQLAGGGAPANGSFDLSFTMFNATSNGVVIAGPITNNATVVTNGLFTTTIDFGGGVFTGSNYWLQVAVRTNGNGAFTMVSPLQPILPTPYAVYSPNAGNAATAITATTATSAVTAGIAGSANSVSAANIVGTIQVMQLPVGVILNNQNSVTLGGRFSGNGSGLTNVAKLSSNQTFTGVNIFNNNVGLGISTPFRNFQVRPAVNSILGIFENTGLGGMTIESVNDANSANQSLEFRGSPSVFTVGNVGIGKTNPAAALDVNGTVTATFFSGNGSGLTNVNLTGPSASSTLGNEALGYQALVANTTGYYNSANGANALSANLTGFKNTATGQAALQNNTSGWQNTATGQGALQNNTTGANNTASGQCALQLNTTGNNNTANGLNSLSHNTIGVNNTAYGFATLYSNTTGDNNTANGFEALTNNITGSYNIAVGNLAGFNIIGSSNIDIGNVGFAADTNIIRIGSAQTQAFIAGQIVGDGSGLSNLQIGQLPGVVLTNRSIAVILNGSFSGNGAGLTNVNLTGPSANAILGNTVNGYQSLQNVTSGSNNTANGQNALRNNTSGSNNIADGYQAGLNITTGNNNIEIGNVGTTNDNNVIYIGTQGLQTNTSIAGVFGATTASGVPVYVTSTGQLGTLTSSARFKTDIQSINNASDVLLSLHPVTFHYKPEIDPHSIPQFGLIAEEVQMVDPDLVTHDDKGNIYTVRYEAVNAMLLNEFLKQHRKLEEQSIEIKDLKYNAAKIETLEKKVNELKFLLLSLNGKH